MPTKVCEASTRTAFLPYRPSPYPSDIDAWALQYVHDTYNSPCDDRYYHDYCYSPCVILDPTSVHEVIVDDGFGEGPQPHIVFAVFSCEYPSINTYPCITSDGQFCCGYTCDATNECYCNITDNCYGCVEPYCKEERKCFYNPDSCMWECDPPPACDPGYHWSNLSCSCEPCPDGTEWCETAATCMRIDPPPCADELGCEFDELLCQYVCPPPPCTGGEVWDEGSCSCVPPCPDGYCWCEDPYTYTGECVPCEMPECGEALNCIWKIYECDWECDDPDEICGPSDSFDYEVCRCGSGGAIVHLRDTNDQYILYHRTQTGTLNGDRWSADDELEEPIEVDEDTDCHCPSFWLLDNVLMGTYLRGEEPKLAVSYDHGKEYEVYDIPGQYAQITSVEHRGRIVFLGFKEGIWYQRVGKIGDDGLVAEADWSDEVAIYLQDSLPGGGATKTPSGKGHLREPIDNVLSVAWEDTDGEWHVSVCRSINLMGIGNWE